MKPPNRFYPPLSFSIGTLVDKLGLAFEQRGDILQAAGVPFKVFLFRDCDHIKRIFAESSVGQTKCPVLLPRVKWVMGNGAYILEGGETWRERRLQVQPAFGRARIVKYANEMSDLLRGTLSRWDDFSNKHTIFDVRHELEMLVARFCFRFLFSRNLTEQEADRIAGLTHNINLHFVRFLPLAIPLPSHRRFRRCWLDLRDMFRGLVQERRTAAAETPDVMSTLIGLRHASTKEAWSIQDIVDEIASIYFGASVVSTTLSWAVYLLVTHQDIQGKLRQTVNEAVGSRSPVVEDLTLLTYTDMVLAETLRLYPPSWTYPRFSKHGMQLDECVIPRRSLLVPAIYHVQRHPRYWTVPHGFDPERFHPENRQTIPEGAYLPFGRGPRTCLGSNLAPLVMQLTLATLFQRYELSFVPEESDPIIDFGFEMHPKGAIRVQIARVRE